MNFRKVDLNLFLVLDAMLREGNVTRVAQKLGISQPTVSTSLNKLRDIYADPLFVRTAKGMQPTPRALALAEPVRRMLGILEQDVLSTRGFEPDKCERTFVINTTEIGEMVFIPPLLKRLREYAPGASLECVCLEPGELGRALGDGRVDLAIGYLPHLSGSSVYVQGLFKHPFVCIFRAGHPLIDDRLTLENYRAAEHIGLMGEGHNQKQFESMINKSGGNRRIAFRSEHFINIPFIVLQSDLVATLPKVVGATFANQPGLRIMKPPFDIPAVPIRQYWHQRLNSDPAQIWLRRNVSDLFLNQDPTVDFVVN